ncbi:hypothetical protein D9758_016879 [Tetrapyrgos nigripes]|uniref:F-box domain-containing protein n=1 Tax=Tetrapyrgos nigripes TaxID=182062 RepID=A0A8H5C0L5_9AGAR|nr:hypothetical protein D9758_016879 [Tetrapyrgos nigripes]
MSNIHINSFPVEILTEIFKSTLHVHPNLTELDHSDLDGNFNFSMRYEGGSMKVDAPTLDISQTCQLWRTIANSIPALWSRMFIHLRCEREAYVDLAKLYLDRSSPTLLKLEFPSSRDINSPAYAPIFNVGTHVGILLLQAFMQERWCWRVVDFNPTTIGMFCQLLQVQPGNCENLETLCLPDSIEFADIPVDLFCSMLGQTPKLRTLVADVYNVRQLVKGLPCNQITTISLPGKTAQRTNWGDHHSLFSHFPNLRELLVTSLFDPWPIVHGGTLVPNVRKLTVEDRYWFDSNGDMLSLSNIFKALKTPSLSTLVLVGRDGHVREQSKCFRHIQEFLRISACHLQHLKLIGDLLDTRKLLELLRQLPTLEHLSIQNGHGRLRVFEGLTVKRRSNKGGGTDAGRVTVSG